MDDLITMHEKAIDLLGMINHYKMVMDRERHNIVQYRNFKELADKAQHRLVIAQMCENRLRERYKNLMTNEKSI